MDEININVEPSGATDELTFLQIIHHESEEFIDSIASTAIPDIDDTISIGEVSGVGIGDWEEMDLHEAEFGDTYVVVDRNFTFVRLDVTEETTGEETEILVNNIDLFVLTGKEWKEQQKDE